MQHACWRAGGGLAGLAAAERLAENESAVTVYDMGTRGPGICALPLTPFCVLTHLCTQLICEVLQGHE